MLLSYCVLQKKRGFSAAAVIISLSFFKVVLYFRIFRTALLDQAPIIRLDIAATQSFIRWA